MPIYGDWKVENMDPRLAISLQHHQQPAPGSTVQPAPGSAVQPQHYPRPKHHRNPLHSKAPKGRLLITEIRIPFVWNERQYFKKRSNDPSLTNSSKKFVIFCIIYTETDMQSTQKVMVDSSMADVVFSELIEFSNITPTTKVHLEVFSYACNTSAHKTIMSPVRKLSRKLTRSLTRTFGRRYTANNAVSSWMQSSSANVNDDLHVAEPSTYKQHGHQMSITSLPNFTKIAETVLTIDELVSGEEGRSYILSSRGFEKVSSRSTNSAAYEIPLFGSFCCRTAVQPYCAIKELQVGRVNIRETRTSNNATGRHSSTGQHYFCTLINAFLYAYNIDRDRRLMEMAIRVDKDSRIIKSAEPNCLELTNKSEAYVLSFDTEEDRRYITNLLRGHVYELAQWDEAALNVRDLKLRPNNGKQELRRRGSLYDEIPVSIQSAHSSSQIRF
ncbi:putative Rhotekin [Hypsibius exemplaris]|uniref:Rhotekin n=1 Tax=Hypsibius exemplaris TaxID=2072580 RepID=A0A1W0W958_HYPEX|nr:putative Rhotekin [Hypsibius exemplaris]